MRIRTRCIAATLCAGLALSGCPMTPTSTDGLEAADFQQISLNGFDPVDNAADHNDYAWAMEYFQPDDKAEGYLYVATGNNMLGMMIEGMMAMIGGGDLEDVPVYPPEIRRYRPDIYIREWETVFDFRDVEAPDFETIGFRFMKVYRAQSDGVNYLYAATFGHQAKVLRSATGEPGSWEVVWESGDVGSVRWMEVHGGLLYLGLANDAPVGEKIGKIWYTDGANFYPYMEDGFGNPDNTAIMSLVSYNGHLYAGTQNQDAGFEIWKMLPLKNGVADPADKNGIPVQVISGGGNDPVNESAIMPCIFNGDLYYGTMIYHMNSIMGGFKGAEIIRIHTDDTWDTIVGPGSLSGYDSGFGHWPNTYIWWIEEHEGWLYASTYDQVSSLTWLLQNIPEVISSILGNLKREPYLLESLFDAGADLYKSPDGVTWYRITNNGLGDIGNYGIRTMRSVDGTLYMGTANPFDGLEVWRSRPGAE